MRIILSALLAFGSSNPSVDHETRGEAVNALDLNNFGDLLKQPGLLKDRIKAELLTPYRVEAIPRGRWQLLSDLVVRVTETTADGRQVVETFTVPAGEIGDGASVPRLLPHAYAWLGGKGRAPSGFHDWAYRVHMEKERADAIFYALLLVDECQEVADAMWLGVHVAGQSAYDHFARLPAARVGDGSI